MEEEEEEGEFSPADTEVSVVSPNVAASSSAATDETAVPSKSASNVAALSSKSSAAAGGAGEGLTLADLEPRIKELERKLHNSGRGGRNRLYYEILHSYGPDIAKQFYRPRGATSVRPTVTVPAPPPPVVPVARRSWAENTVAWPPPPPVRRPTPPAYPPPQVRARGAAPAGVTAKAVPTNSELAEELRRLLREHQVM